MNESEKQIPSRSILNDLKYGVWKATAVKAALELDLFTTIAKGYKTLGEIGAETGCSERGLRILLDALCPLGLLTKGSGQYALTPTSDAFLVRERPTYYGEWYLKTQLAWEARALVAEGVRRGASVGVDVSKPDAEELWLSCEAPSMVTWPLQTQHARHMWEQLEVSKETRPGLHILDAASGSAVNSLVLAQTDPAVHVTALDSPKVLHEVTAKVAQAMGVRKQVSFCCGDLLDIDLGSQRFDLVHFGLILYYFSCEQVREILRRTHTALKRGGLVVVNSPIADEERCRHEIALMVALQLFIFAPRSEVYTFRQYQDFLEQAGFTRVTHHTDFLISALKEK